ncbi:hypothetical protein BHM03_00060556 [Ensete ventricosum]|nr:hypothetical protein BHM03_00060556 [Ensete ventricosum]
MPSPRTGRRNCLLVTDHVEEPRKSSAQGNRVHLGTIRYQESPTGDGSRGGTMEAQREREPGFSLFFYLFFFLPPSANIDRKQPPTAEIDCRRYHPRCRLTGKPVCTAWYRALPLGQANLALYETTIL